MVAVIVIAWLIHGRSYWRQNIRALRASWNVLKMLRHADLLLDNDDDDDRAVTREISDESDFFQEFCVTWPLAAGDGGAEVLAERTPATRKRDETLLRESECRLPVEYAAYVDVSADLLTQHWSRFVSNKCSNYHDKLICSNGLVFDWQKHRVYRWQ